MALAMSSLIALLGWSMRSKHDDAMKRIEKMESLSTASSERLAKVETKQDALTDVLREIRSDVKEIRSRLENRVEGQ